MSSVTKLSLRVIVAITLLAVAAASFAQRRPVLQQVDLPHPYYWREMYVPQLTSGPSSASWAPDSQTLVFSMQGSLWKQRVDSDTAEQLTEAPGYDYQPDWSPDGKWIIYDKYDHDTIELWLYEVATGKSKALTKNSGVNLEPRWSPDGKHIAF